jgi:hypothetical protein
MAGAKELTGVVVADAGPLIALSRVGEIGGEIGDRPRFPLAVELA